MKNNNIKILVLFTTMLTIFSSCEKWLDVQPTTKMDRSELFKTEEGYRTALAGVYSDMTSTSMYGREMTYGTMDVLAGYYYPANSNPQIYYNFYWNYPYKRENSNKNDNCVSIIDAMWNGMYKSVANLNSLLETIDANKSIFSGDNYNIIKGEAIGLRAFLHLDLLRMYGPSYIADPTKKCIPYVDSLAPVVFPLLSVEEASNKIISELKKALVLMENDPIKTGQAPSGILASAISTSTLPVYHNRKYHFNYYAVEAALARVYLWKGDNVNALKYAKDVIAVQSSRFPWVLDANLSSVNTTGATNKDRTFTTEHIFALNIRDLESTVPTYLSLVGAGTKGGQLLYCKSSTRNTIYENSTVDPRSQYFFVANGSSYFFPTKLYQEESTSIWFKYQMPLIRISEMYYIAAECEPNALDGLAWLNTARVARKLTALTGISSNVALQTEIRKEYQKEFICEGQLWFYYKRLNLAKLPLTSRFSDTGNYVFDMPENEYLYGGRK